MSRLGRWIVATTILLVCSARPAASSDLLATLVLEDVAGTSWSLDDLQHEPVLLVIADRRASKQAEAWGARLVARTTKLAPWKAAGKVAWLSIADLHGVPEYARDTARTRLREQDADRQGERAVRSPLLLDWNSLLAERVQAERGMATLVLLSREHEILTRASGMPTEAALTRMIEAITRVSTP